MIARRGWEFDENSVHLMALAVSLAALNEIDDMIIDGLLDS